MDKDEYPAWPPQRAARFGGRAEGAARREDPLGAAAPTRPAGFPPPPPVGAAGRDRYITGLSGPLPGARRVVPQRSSAPLSLCEARACFVFAGGTGGAFLPKPAASGRGFGGLCSPGRPLLAFGQFTLPPGPGIFRRSRQRPSALFCLRRVHFCTHKSEPKKRQPPSGWTPAFAQPDAPRLDSAQPLNARILRASDLRRVSQRCFGRWPC